MLGVNLYYVCSSMGQSAVFDVAPPTTAPPAARNWWGWRATAQKKAARKWGEPHGCHGNTLCQSSTRKRDTSRSSRNCWIHKNMQSSRLNKHFVFIYFLFRRVELLSQNSEFRWKLKANVHFIWIFPNFLLPCLHTTDKNVILKLYIYNWQTIVTTIRLLYFLFCYGSIISSCSLG